MDLNKKWKVWIYRIGLIGTLFYLNIIGLILIGINANLNWGNDILKKKKNPKFNGKLEAFFYIMGYLSIVLLIIGLLNELVFNLLK